jgi:hypothetical protein
MVAWLAAEDLVMAIEKPHFTVKLHKTVLEVDLTKGLKKELEDVLEARPALRESLGVLFQTVIPLDVRLRDIRSAKVDDKGQVKITIPSRRDIVIPLGAGESKRLVDKMNKLIPAEKERAVKEAAESKKVRREYEPEIAQARAGAEGLERIR